MTTLETVVLVIELQTGKEDVCGGTPIAALGLDSLDFLDLLLAIAQATGLEVPDERVSEIETVADIVKALA